MICCPTKPNARNSTAVKLMPTATLPIRLPEWVAEWAVVWAAVGDHAADLKADGASALPKLHGALLKNEQDVHLFERLAFMARGQR